MIRKKKKARTSTFSFIDECIMDGPSLPFLFPIHPKSVIPKKSTMARVDSMSGTLVMSEAFFWSKLCSRTLYFWR